MSIQVKFSLILAIALALLQPWTSAAAGTLRYDAVPRQMVEARLGKYAGNNKRREETLKQMFAEAGCDDRHLSEQPVKGSKLPNVICVLPGSSDKFIIVGAHFDHVSVGDGVVDNWSGASLLPSLYEAVKHRNRFPPPMRWSIWTHLAWRLPRFGQAIQISD